MFFLIRAWVNNREAGDLLFRRAHYDVIVMRVIANGILNNKDRCFFQRQFNDFL